MKFLGICGREGAGKTTVANILQNNHEDNWEMHEIDNPLMYIAFVLFGFPLHTEFRKSTKEPVWGMTQEEAFKVISDILIEYVDRDWFAKHPNGQKYKVPIPLMKSDKKWIEISMADPLKSICSIIYDIPYEVLLAQTPETRKIRETVIYPPQNVTGRHCLEYFGTDVMRNCFDNDVWIKILERDSKNLISMGYNIVVPDIRFPNEGEMIDRMNGTLMTIYRDPNDLVLTDEDKKTHPAKWTFLTFREKVKNPIDVHNNGSIEDLSIVLKNILQF